MSKIVGICVIIGILMVIGGTVLAISDVLPEEGSLNIFVPIAIIIGGFLVAIIPITLRDVYG